MFNSWQPWFESSSPLPLWRTKPIVPNNIVIIDYVIRTHDKAVVGDVNSSLADLRQRRDFSRQEATATHQRRADTSSSGRAAERRSTTTVDTTSTGRD